MATVDFFEARGPCWEETLCRRVEEEYAAGRRVYVWASGEAHARRIDDLLWLFRDDAFIPHGLRQGKSPPDAPVCVGWDRVDASLVECLVLACDPTPSEVEGFARVLDFAPVDDPTLRGAARARFRAYREAGLTVTFHAPP